MADATGLTAHPQNPDRRRRMTIIAVIVALLLIAAALMARAIGTAGAEFSSTVQGSIGGVYGTISLTPTSNSGDLNIQFNKPILPGNTADAQFTFQNTGNSPADAHMVFNNLTALSALNNTGAYSSVTITVDGTTVFHSDNLNDNTTTCPPNSTTPQRPYPCHALPSDQLLVGNVQPGQNVTVVFEYTLANKATTQPPNNTTAWNPWPVAEQVTTIPADGTGSGLPFQLVGTEVGQPIP